MKRTFIFVLIVVLFACQSSFASKKSEFKFGVDKILTYSLENSVNYTDGKKDKIKKVTIREEGKEREAEFVEKVDNVLSATLSKDYGSNGLAPKLEYCYYVIGHRMGVGLGVNKFFNSDFDPFNVYAILKANLPINHEAGDGFSFGANLGYGIFNDKYETVQGTFKADKVYSAKFFVKLDYKNFFIDLSAMTNIIPINAKINTVNEGVKHLEKNIKYDVIMLGIGYKFAI
jgi:hypothetical protein